MLTLTFTLGISACSTGAAPLPTEKFSPTQTLLIENSIEPAQIPTITPLIDITPKFGFTHQRADGNHFVEGRGNLRDSTSIEIALDGTPEWVIAVPYEDFSFWTVVLEDGRVQTFWISPQGVENAQIAPDQLRPGSPPLLFIENENPQLVTVPSLDQSPFTHPIYLVSQGLRAYIQTDGSLALMDANDQIIATLAVDALPDARILSDETGRLLLLSGPTSKYDHGVVGDELEATSITLIDTIPEPGVITIIPVPDGQVIEGIAPIWADLNNDGVREIIVTLSDGLQGAQIVVYGENGTRIALGDAVGLGYRWRHQIAVAPFGPNGEWEVADVLTPHIGGVVEFFQLNGDRLSKTAQVEGYTSHVIRSRNLDMAAAGDFDGDGHVELLLPNQVFTQLGAIRRNTGGAEVVWSLALDGQMNTNLGAVTLNTGAIILGVGRTDNVLKIWLP